MADGVKIMTTYRRKPPDYIDSPHHTEAFIDRCPDDIKQHIDK
jgi:hypothetical protein